MAALVAVMIMVSVGHLRLAQRRSAHPATDAAQRHDDHAVTVVVTVVTHNLAYGVIVGVLVATVFFARRVAHFTEVVDVAHPDENTRVYAVRGPLFFASSNDLVYQFDYVNDPAEVIIDLSGVADLRLLDGRHAGRDRAEVPPARQARRASSD